MNREIKFRAWIPEQKRMAYDDFAINAKDGKMFGYLRPSSSGGGNGWRAFPIEEEFWKDNPPAVMQSTGEKDKNGKDIFEGDLIKGRTFYYDEKIKNLVFTEESNGHVWYINGSWNVSFNHLYSECSCHLEKFDLYSTEVIGNIFENPELIKA